MSWIRAVPERYLSWFREEALSRAPYDIMLDVGGGDGTKIRPLIPLARNVFVLDISEGPGRDIVGDAHHLPICHGRIDYLTCIEVLEHAAYPDQFVGELRRVMKAGALLQLTTRQYWRTHGSPNDFFRFTEQGLRRLLRDAGFVVERATPMGGPFTVIAAAWDQFCGQIGLGRPVLKQVFVYPVWIIATVIDGFYLRTYRFASEPDTTGWCITARSA